MQSAHVSTSALGIVSAEWGYAAILGLTVGYGMMYLPTKKYDTGNGKHLCFI